MAEGFLRSFDPGLKVYSAGTDPAESVHPLAIKVMLELGIDLSNNKPKHVDGFLETNFEYVITVCGGAKESCPSFTGNVKHRLHMGYDDPADAKGSIEEKMKVFRRVRDEIRNGFKKFYDNNLIDV